MLIYIVDTLETVAHVDRPCERADTDLKFLLKLVEDVERVAALAVELVDEDYDRGAAHAAHLHQAAGLRLDTFGGIDHDDYRVNSRERAERVFGEVLVTRSVEDVDLVVTVIESHHGGCDRNATLLLDFHPVGGGGLLDLVALHGTGHMYGATEEKKFLGEGCLTRVGVGDDGECAPAFYFLVKLFHEMKLIVVLGMFQAAAPSGSGCP